jgi:hypothetical protein
MRVEIANNPGMWFFNVNKAFRAKFMDGYKKCSAYSTPKKYRTGRNSTLEILTNPGTIQLHQRMLSREELRY